MTDTECTTRRAPHMERFVTFRPTAIRDGWYVYLKVGVQEFVIAPCWDTEEEARHCRDMLCIALDALGWPSWEAGRDASAAWLRSVADYSINKTELHACADRVSALKPPALGVL